MRIVALMALVGAAVVPAAAQAEPVQTAEDIVKFFAASADLGATRGICVGTEEECASKKRSQEPAGLDMLVNFELDSADLTADARAKLGQFAEALKDSRLKSHSFVVEGYTDASGPETYNLSLSERRARSVSAFLLEQGIEPQRINAVGYGEGRPRAENPYDAANRRVEMRIQLP